MSKLNDKPIKVVPHKGRHKTETRVFARNIHESFCAQPTCEFYGKHSAQGICHTRLDRGFPHKYFNSCIQAGQSVVMFYREQYKKKPKKAYLKFIENMCVSEFANNRSMLDELIKVRTENSKLRNRLGLYK